MFIYFLFQNFGRGNCGVGCVGVGVVSVTYLGNMISGVKYWLDFGGMVCEKRAGQGKWRGESS